ncbi:hypothetical protein FA95DRAFT_1465145, partial [Auriscalpium vulgare]
LVKMVNLMTVKMEIGSPMASLFNLGFGGHVTSETFKPVFWQNYVAPVRNFWAMDYMYRPILLNNMNVYEWCRTSIKRRIPKSRRKPMTDDESGNEHSDGEHQVSNHNDEPSDSEKISSESDHGDSDSDYQPTTKQRLKRKRRTRKEYFRFTKDHPEYPSHEVSINSEEMDTVPNFIGKSLPRRDKGNREIYCITMLTLFKAWRAPGDLKSPEQTWEEAFAGHQFSVREKHLMDNFQIRHECRDAHDDYAAQRR